MAKFQWLARVLGLDGTSQDADGFATFEHVDGSRMAANEFHLSDSMRLDEAHLSDFAETLPACSHYAITPAMRSPRPVTAPHRAHTAGHRAH